VESSIFFYTTLGLNKYKFKDSNLSEVKERIMNSKLLDELSIDEYEQFKYHILLSAYHIILGP
jgi:hypothetical protein